MGGGWIPLQVLNFAASPSARRLPRPPPPAGRFLQGAGAGVSEGVRASHGRDPRASPLGIPGGAGSATPARCGGAEAAAAAPAQWGKPDPGARGTRAAASRRWRWRWRWGRGAAAAGERRWRARGAGRTPQLLPLPPRRSPPSRAAAAGCGLRAAVRPADPGQPAREPARPGRPSGARGASRRESPRDRAPGLSAAAGARDVRGREAEPGAPQRPARAPWLGRAERNR